MYGNIPVKGDFSLIFETERLQLIPLSVDQLIMLRDDIERFEEYHNCTIREKSLRGS